MVDNRGLSPVSSPYFKAGDANSMANKMSEEKYGQGGEYFAQEIQEKEEEKKQSFQDRSAQLRASLDGLAAANASTIRIVKISHKKDEEEKKKQKNILLEEDETEEKEELYE